MNTSTDLRCSFGYNSRHMKNYFYIFALLLFVSGQAVSQNIDKRESRLSFSFGYGASGGFSATGYFETPPFPTAQYRDFSRKNFIGNAKEFNIGYRLNKAYELNAGLSLQSFTRRVRAMDTLSTVVVRIDNTIHDRNSIFYATLCRLFESQNSIIRFGLGIYYIRPKSESIEYGLGIPTFFSNYEARYDNSRFEEAGSLVEAAYEYKFQPKVNIGIKTQFFYTISAGYSESVTLLPYIKILF